MAGRVNTKFVIILAVVLVVLVAGAGAATFFVMRTDPQHLIQRGDEFAEAGNWNKAVEQYGKALRSKRDDVDLILRYTQAVKQLTTSTTIDARKYIEQMLTWWRRASELDPANPAPVEELMGLYISLGRDLGDVGSWDRMYEQSQALLSVNSKMMVARKYRGIAQVNRMRSTEVNDQDRLQARDDLLAVLERDPNDAEAIYHLALWNVLESRRVATGALGDPKLAQQLRDEAVNRLTQSVASHPQDRRRMLDLVSVLIDPAVNDVERAESILTTLEADMLANPAAPQQILTVADLLMRVDRDPVDAGGEDTAVTGGLMRAQALLKKAADANPEDIRFRVAYGRALSMMGKTDEAIAVLDAARKLKGQAPAIEALRSADLRLTASLQYADLLLNKAANTEDTSEREKLIDDVDEIIRFLRTESGDNASVSLLAGKLDLARNDVGNALKRFSAASAQFGDRNPEALLLTARAAMTMREWGAATTALQKLIEIRPDLEMAHLELARLYLQLQDRDRAKARIQYVLRENPDNADARMMLLSIDAGEGNVDAAIAELKSRGAEKDPRMSLQLVQLYMAAGKVDQAKNLLAERFETDPSNLAVLQAMLRISGDRDEGLKLVTRAREAGGDARSLDLLEKQLKGEEIDIGALVEEEISKIDDPLRRHVVRGSLYERMGKRPEAKAEYEAAASIDADNATVVASLFNIALQEQDWAGAEKLAAKAAKLSLDLAEGLFYYGRLELARGRPDEAINSFRRGLTLRQTYSEGHRMLADALRARNDLAAAVESYRRAMEQKPDNVAAIRGLAITYDAMRDPVNALAMLKRAVQFAPNDRQLLENYLAYEMEYGNPREVVATRSRIAMGNPGDTDNRRALALLYAQLGDQAQATQIMDDLVKLQGMTRVNAGATAAIQRAGGDLQAAAGTLDGYIQSRGDDADMDDYLMLGRFFMGSGLIDQALASYRLAIEREDKSQMPATRELADVLFDRGAGEEAAGLYKQLFEANPQDTRVALRYAETLLRTGKIADAVAVIDAETKRSGDSVEALLLRSLIALQKGDNAAAIKLLDTAIEKDPARAMTYYQRAQARAGDPKAEREVTADLNRAIDLEPNMISARLLRAGLARQREDYSGAILELRNILTNNPNIVEARLQLVDLYFDQARYNELESLLDESAKLFPQEPTWPRIRAQVAERRNRPEDAVRFYARAFELAPVPANLGNLALATLQAGKPKDALAMLDKHPDMVSTVPTLLAVRGRAQHAAGDSTAGNESFALAVQRCANYGQAQAVTAQIHGVLSADETTQLVETAGASLQRTWTQLAIAQMLMGDARWTQALDRLRAIAPAITPDSPERLPYLQMNALALYQTGAYDQAKTAYELLNEAQPSNVGTLNNLAYLLVENLNQVEQGLSLAEEAARLAPDNAQVLDTLGWAQFKAGQVDKAIATLQRSLRAEELAPNQYHLGVALKKAGDRAGALQALSRAKALAEQTKDESLRDQADKALRELGS